MINMKIVYFFVLSFAVFINGFFSTAVYAENTFTIGYLELKKDPRYKKKRLLARFTGQALGRPFAGAEVAIKEAKYHGIDIDTVLLLERKTVKKEELTSAVEEFNNQGVQFIVLDLPSFETAELLKKIKGKDIAFFNATSYDNTLRNESCQSNLFHTLPSHAMLMDALAQYLISKKWKNILVLEGELAEDKQMSSAFEIAAKRFGLKIKDKRIFKLGNDPRERSKNNVALLTKGDFDVIFIADTNGEYARDLPYQSLKPNLIVGSEGLSASAWHWGWERHGAPQLIKRFIKKHKRLMENTDWAAWMAVKVIAAGVQDTKSTDYKKITAYLTADNTVLDTFKGHASSFRPWNNQLRQTILLTTHNWVVTRAPLKGFLHQKNNLDTLGNEKRNSKCVF
ncbi:MAG: ABC transporter substrate-binding protein [Cocleimonas sp.]|nr:ABC transporter substrate-binding protein [Cocleimonas sp.]